MDYIAHQAPLFMELPRQKYWSELLFPSSMDLPDAGIELGLPVLAGRFFTAELPGKLWVNRTMKQELRPLVYINIQNY